MTLKIKHFIIAIITVIQLIGYTKSFCNTTYTNRQLYKHNHIINDINLYLPKKTLSYNDNHRKYPFNYIYNVNNTIITCPYFHQSPFSLLEQNISKIRIQNNSIHMSYMFYNYQNNYHKFLPFMQLGFQKNFSAKIVSIGGGSRYAYNHMYAYGYNVFYHFPIFVDRNMIRAVNIHQSPYINISGEYWYRNTLLILNSFYKINNFIDAKNNLQENKNYPHSGYQIHIQNQFLKFLEVTGKVTLEHFLYKKLSHDQYSKKNKNCNYRLICSVDYHPIPILSININKVFTNSKAYNNLTCQVCIDYQFNIPITQQICCINDNKKYPSIFLHLNEIMQPFFPVAPDFMHNRDNYEIMDNMLKNCYIEEITGYPGERKLININTDTKNNNMQNNQYIQWNMQTLQTLYQYGGNITLSREKNNTYIIHMPIQVITKEQQLIISYVIMDYDNTKNCCNTNIEKKMIILVKNFQQKKIKNDSTNSTIDLSNTTVTTNDDNFKKLNTSKVNNQHQIYDTLIEVENSDHHVDQELSCSISQKSSQHSIVYNDPSINKVVNIQDSSGLNIQNNDALLCHLQSTKNISLSDNNIIQDDAAQKAVISSCHTTTPIPPPLLPLSLLISEKNVLKPVLNQTLLKNNNYSDCSATHQKDINNHQNAQTMTSSLSISVLPQQTCNQKKSKNIETDTNISSGSGPTLQENLLYLLSTHKKHKFSSVGTVEHINKLENFTINKKSKNVSEMEKIFAKLHLTQSASSIDESYCTTEDESD